MIAKKSMMLALLGFSLTLRASDLPVDARIEQAMFGKHRSEANQQRNRYRHPVGTLTFFGLDEGMTVLEIWPGNGWYTEILAPVVRHDGQLIVATWDADIEGQPAYRYRLNGELVEKFAANPDIYDQVAVVAFTPPESASLGEADSVDLILTFRNTHGWISDGVAELIFSEFSRVLKPGGVLGIVQHRADRNADPEVTAQQGYVSEHAVIELARAAGLYLEDRSEVNSNPADTHDHAEGVWSLPPNLAVCTDLGDPEEKAACEAPFLAIGESDRMTLRFRKPLN